jgi:hypothetical protein
MASRKRRAASAAPRRWNAEEGRWDDVAGIMSRHAPIAQLDATVVLDATTASLSDARHPANAPLLSQHLHVKRHCSATGHHDMQTTTTTTTTTTTATTATSSSGDDGGARHSIVLEPVDCTADEGSLALLRIVIDTYAGGNGTANRSLVPASMTLQQLEFEFVEQVDVACAGDDQQVVELHMRCFDHEAQAPQVVSSIVVDYQQELRTDMVVLGGDAPTTLQYTRLYAVAYNDLSREQSTLPLPSLLTLMALEHLLQQPNALLWYCTVLRTVCSRLMSDWRWWVVRTVACIVCHVRLLAIMQRQ